MDNDTRQCTAMGHSMSVLRETNINNRNHRGPVISSWLALFSLGIQIKSCTALFTSTGNQELQPITNKLGQNHLEFQLCMPMEHRETCWPWEGIPSCCWDKAQEPMWADLRVMYEKEIVNPGTKNTMHRLRCLDALGIHIHNLSQPTKHQVYSFMHTVFNRHLPHSKQQDAENSHWVYGELRAHQEVSPGCENTGENSPVIWAGISKGPKWGRFEGSSYRIANFSP